MSKMRNDYFEYVTKQTAFCVEAAEFLEATLLHYSQATIHQQREQMHEIENQADELHHEIRTKLSAEFITPIDQEDILHLVQLVDDVTDALDEVVLELYMFHVETLPPYAIPIASIVCNCVNALHEATKELKNFKKPDALRVQLVRVNTIEGEADAAFVEAIHELFQNETNCKDLVRSKSIYESLENCCDLCEYAADVIEQIIIKNT